MSVHLNGNVIVLEGACRVEDAEPLLGFLQADRTRLVDLTDADHLHAAVLQVLMALRPALKGTGKETFMRDWIVPALMMSEPVDMTSRKG